MEDTLVDHLTVRFGARRTEVAAIVDGVPRYADVVEVGSETLDASIMAHVAHRFGVALGEQTTVGVRSVLGRARPRPENSTSEVRGRSRHSGAPVTIVLSSREVDDAVSLPFRQILETVRSTLARFRDTAGGDIAAGGIVIAADLPLLAGFEELLRETTQLQVRTVGS